MSHEWTQGALGTWTCPRCGSVEDGDWNSAPPHPDSPVVIIILSSTGGRGSAWGLRHAWATCDEAAVAKVLDL